MDISDISRHSYIDIYKIILLAIKINTALVLLFYTLLLLPFLHTNIQATQANIIELQLISLVKNIKLFIQDKLRIGI